MRYWCWRRGKSAMPSLHHRAIPKAIIPFGPEYTSSTSTHEESHANDTHSRRSVCFSGAYTAFIVQLLSGQRAMSPCPNMSCRCCHRPYPRSIRGDQHRIPLRKYALHTSVVVGYHKGSNRPHPLPANAAVHRSSYLLQQEMEEDGCIIRW